MTGLTHDQARRNLHAAADKCLNPKDRTALEAHLAECAPCRAYADEISWLNAAIARALRGRWAPHRYPIDMIARVRNRMRLDAERMLLLGFAHAFVRLGSLVVMAAFIVGLLQAPGVRLSNSGALSTHTSAALAGGHRSNLPAYELVSDNEQALFPASSNAEADTSTDVPSSRMSVTQY